MGTSGSTSGPGDKMPLLPSWATPPGSPEAPATPDPKQQPKTAPASQPRRWQSAKGRLSSVASGGSGSKGIASAGRAYTRALGGGGSAASSAASARAATSRLGHFLASVSTGGVSAALESLGLGRFVGRDAETVFAAIADALAPEGTDREQVATREAINDTLAYLYEEYVLPDGDLAGLEAMTPESIREAIEASVTASIFHRWLGDLERRLEEKAVSAPEAIRLERDIEAHIRDTIHLDLQGKDPLRVDWSGAEGQAFVQHIYEEAYSILEAQR